VINRTKYLPFILISSNEGKVVVCSSYDSATSSLSLTDVLESIFQFSRDNVEQFLVVNIKSENVEHPVNTKELESAIEEKCKIHTELTAGTKEYKLTEVKTSKNKDKRVIYSLLELVSFY
jgi:hypothetical protein